ncbi:conjugal transfer protein TraA, partial [Xanthomonas citri pv. citri]
TGELNELVLACETVGVPADVLAVSLPELAALLTRFTEDS